MYRKDNKNINLREIFVRVKRANLPMEKQNYINT